jgi:hypothetical protein
VSTRRKRWAVAAAGCAAVVVTGCSSAQQPAVEQVAKVFEDQTADPGKRCDLLAPASRSALEEQASQSCSQAVQDLPLAGGDVRSVAVWGGAAQVRLTGDTLFLTQTNAGWRVAAAACRSRGEAPYDCQVEGP